MSYKIVNEEQIPISKNSMLGKWDKLLNAIPPGKAMVIPASELTPQRVYGALRTRHGNGKYLNYSCRILDASKKTARTYIIHHSTNR